jgi:hypothetical protein
MGAWGELAFDNDTANDWASELADAHDLSPVEAALSELESVGTGYLDQDVACVALAAYFSAIPADSITRALVVIPTSSPQNHSKSNSALIGK